MTQDTGEDTLTVAESTAPTSEPAPAPAPVPTSAPNSAPNSAPTSADYAQWYYAHACGKPYDVSDPRWLEFFDGIADRLIAIANPSSVLDAGCAMGILVGSLRARGVDAEGIDLSEYAVQNGDPRAEGHLRVGQLEDPLPRRYDLISVIEVLEHIEAGTVEKVVANLCTATDVVLLSTTPEDFNEGTHVNVRPPSYWAALFAEQGLYRRFDVDASFVSPWAVLLERRDGTARRLVADYETVLWDLKRENRGARTALINRDRQISALEAVAKPELVTERDQAVARASSAEAQLRVARGELQAALREVRAVRASRRYRLGTAVVTPAARVRKLARRVRRRLG